MVLLSVVPGDEDEATPADCDRLVEFDPARTNEVFLTTLRAISAPAGVGELSKWRNNNAKSATEMDRLFAVC